MSSPTDGVGLRESPRPPVTQRLVKGVVQLLVVFVVIVLALGAFAYARSSGWLSPFGIQSQTEDTQVVFAIERTEQVSLLSLGIQGITERDTSRSVLGHTVPGTGRQVFIEYTFRAKLGLDGSKVQVTKTGTHAYSLTVPSFIFIGYSTPVFKTATSSNGLLSFTTPSIDTSAIVTQILGTSQEQKYVSSNTDLLESQTKVFYDSLIRGIDPTAQVTFHFGS